MIKKISVLPRMVVDNTIIKSGRGLLSNEAIISISDMEFPDLFETSNKQILCLRFSDITEKQYYKIMTEQPNNDFELELFNEYDAKKIIEFVDNLNDDIKILYVNCFMGVSRSGAVSLFINRYLKLNEKEFIKENPNIHPNEWILKILTKVSGINSDYENFWNSIKTDFKPL